MVSDTLKRSSISQFNARPDQDRDDGGEPQWLTDKIASLKTGEHVDVAFRTTRLTPEEFFSPAVHDYIVSKIGSVAYPGGLTDVEKMAHRKAVWRAVKGFDRDTDGSVMMIMGMIQKRLVKQDDGSVKDSGPLMARKHFTDKGSNKLEMGSYFHVRFASESAPGEANGIAEGLGDHEFFVRSCLSPEMTEGGEVAYTETADAVLSAFLGSLERSRDGRGTFDRLAGAVVRRGADDPVEAEESGQKVDVGNRRIYPSRDRRWAWFDTDGLPIKMLADLRRDSGHAVHGLAYADPETQTRALIENQGGFRDWAFKAIREEILAPGEGELISNPDGVVSLEAFADVDIDVQWSSSMGRTDKQQGIINVHMFARTDRGYDDKVMQTIVMGRNCAVQKRWAEILRDDGVPEDEMPDMPNVLDFRTFVSVQPIYAAPPRFDGVKDPFEGKDRFFLDKGVKPKAELSRVDLASEFAKGEIAKNSSRAARLSDISTKAMRARMEAAAQASGGGDDYFSRVHGIMEGYVSGGGDPRLRHAFYLASGSLSPDEVVEAAEEHLPRLIESMEAVGESHRRNLKDYSEGKGDRGDLADSLTELSGRTSEKAVYTDNPMVNLVLRLAAVGRHEGGGYQSHLPSIIGHLGKEYGDTAFGGVEQAFLEHFVRTVTESSTYATKDRMQGDDDRARYVLNQGFISDLMRKAVVNRGGRGPLQEHGSRLAKSQLWAASPKDKEIRRCAVMADLTMASKENEVAPGIFRCRGDGHDFLSVFGPQGRLVLVASETDPSFATMPDSWRPVRQSERDGTMRQAALHFPEQTRSRPGKNGGWETYVPDDRRDLRINAAAAIIRPYVPALAEKGIYCRWREGEGLTVRFGPDRSPAPKSAREFDPDEVPQSNVSTKLSEVTRMTTEMKAGRAGQDAAAYDPFKSI